MEKRIRLLAMITLVLLGFAVSSRSQAVVPPPDGAYPGFNTAEGQNALFGLTTGVANSAVGWFSLFSNADGSFNTGLGAGTLLFNVGNQSTGDGTQNTALGRAALLNNTTGAANTATGVLALINNTIGGGNTATGVRALLNNTTGSLNTAIGIGALLTANGHDNTAIGASALLNNTTGSLNTGIGFNALFNNTTGGTNIALGVNAGSEIVTASNVSAIGTVAGDVSDSCFIGNIFGATSSVGTAVLINSNGKLGTTTSSRRFKEEIKPMDQASEALFALKPVAFRYKKGIDPQGIPQFGLVAEEVEAVNPDLVVRDADEKAYTVRYDQVNAMLLNEFLKEHKRVEELDCRLAEQEAIVAQQKKEFRERIATVENHAAEIHKVGAHVELSEAPLLAAETP